MNYYLAKNNEQQGPFTEDELAGMVRRGECLLSDLIWRAGMDEWKPISAIPEIATACLSAEPILVTGTGNLNGTANQKTAAHRIGKVVGGLLYIIGALLVIFMIGAANADSAMRNENKGIKHNQNVIFHDSAKVAGYEVGFGIGSLFLAGYGLVQIIEGLTSVQVFKRSSNKFNDPTK